ncbi:MAG: hypothetical protein ACRC8R_12105 [Aeromonas hydrophila]
MKNWKIGTGYEQGEPGLYIYEADTGRVVVAPGEAPSEQDAERIALCVASCSAVSSEEMRNLLKAVGELPL